VTDHGAFVLINVYGPNVGGKGGGLDAEGRVEERRAYKGEFYKVCVCVCVCWGAAARESAVSGGEWRRSLRARGGGGEGREGCGVVPDVRRGRVGRRGPRA
jgi:hypothetical protein